MSHNAIVDYESLSLQCKATCDLASAQLCKIDKSLTRINENAQTLLNSQIKAYEKTLLDAKTAIKTEITNLTEVALREKSKGKVSVGEYQTLSLLSNNVAVQAKKLEAMANGLTSKLIVVEEMINEAILDCGRQVDQHLKNQVDGIIEIDQTTIDYLGTIEDISLREFVYREAVKDENKRLSFEQLLNLGKTALAMTTKKAIETNQDKIVSEITEDMQNAKVDPGIIHKVVGDKKTLSAAEIFNIRESASKEIIGEQIRRESLAIIVKSIEKRGFIVDRKNIKINREKNEVRMVALKVSGEQAEFKIFLDGKFIYKFDGYEGQACQKDLQPFMKDLEEIYGIKILKQEEIWSNPDKISSMKYQTVNKNKGTN